MKERHVLDHGCLSSQLRRCRAAHGRCRPLPGTESFPDVLLVFLAVAIATAFSFADEQAAVGGPFVSINGKPWTPERPPIRMSGVILVPAREFATAVGATLSWDQQAKMVTVTREGASFQAWAGQNVAVINNQPRALSVSPPMVNDTLYLPLDALVSAFGGEFTWLPDTETALVAIGGTTYRQVVGTLIRAYDGPPPAVLVLDSSSSQYRAFALRDETTIQMVAEGRAAAPASIGDLRPGDLVRVFVDEEGRPAQLLAAYSVVEGTVERAEGQSLQLSDGRVIQLLDTAEILDAAGKPASPDTLGPGARLRARVNPTTMHSGQVTVLQPAAGREEARIQAVGILDPRPAYTPGSVIRVRLLGTPGGSAAFTVAGVVSSVPMREVAAGRYEGTAELRVPQGQEKRAALTGSLTVGARTVTRSLPQPILIDGKPPTLSDPSPAPDTAVEGLRPTISAAFRDDGSGVDLDTVRMSLDDRDVTRQLTLTSSRCSLQPENDLAPGAHRVVVQAADKAGNAATLRWTFRIATGPARKIVSVAHNAQDPLAAGEVLRVTVVTTEPGNRCWATVGGLTINLNRQQAAQPNRVVYAGSYTVRPNDKVVRGKLVAHFADANGREETMDASTPVTLRGDWPSGVRITSPAENATITGEFRVEGVAKPGATIRVIVTYRKERILAFQGEVARFTVKADETGKWQTDPIDPKIPLIGMADTYTISAELLDGDQVKAREQRTVKRG